MGEELAHPHGGGARAPGPRGQSQSPGQGHQSPPQPHRPVEGPRGGWTTPWATGQSRPRRPGVARHRPQQLSAAMIGDSSQPQHRRHHPLVQQQVPRRPLCLGVDPGPDRSGRITLTQAAPRWPPAYPSLPQTPMGRGAQLAEHIIEAARAGTGEAVPPWPCRHLLRPGPDPHRPRRRRATMRIPADPGDAMPGT